VDAGLVEKSRGSYKRTFLGRIVNESFLRPLDAFKSGGNGYALLSKLQSSNLDPETKKEFENTFVDSEAFSLLGRGNLTDSMRVIHIYEQLIEQVFEMVEKTEHSLYFVSKYTDGRIAEAIVKATERGVQSSCISERKTLSESLQAVRMLINPKLLKSVLKMVTNANNMLRYVDFIPFSFAVSDEERIIVELPNPLTHNFCIAFVFQDRIFGKKLVGIFKDLWDKGRFPLEDEDAENKADAHR
jgi:hypothetical protein